MATIVAKIGSSSITDHEGRIASHVVAKLCREVAGLRALGHRCVIVTSGAIAAGLPLLGLGGDKRPRDPSVLQAVSAVGQGRLIGHYMDELATHGLVGCALGDHLHSHDPRDARVCRSVDTPRVEK